jgi:hypothetical protein
MSLIKLKFKKNKYYNVYIQQNYKFQEKGKFRVS